MTIEELLTSIADLLDTHGVPDLSEVFRRLRSDFKDDPHETKRRIRSSYGGMGSFNDLVLLTPDGIPLREEKNELDRLRSELYQQCQLIRRSDGQVDGARG